MDRARASVVAVSLGLAAASCTHGDAAPLGADFGNAVRHNEALHVIDPEPPYAAYGAPALDGNRARIAIDRYERGAVIVPEAIETTDFVDDR